MNPIANRTLDTSGLLLQCAREFISLRDAVWPDCPPDTTLDAIIARAEKQRGAANTHQGYDQLQS